MGASHSPAGVHDSLLHNWYLDRASFLVSRQILPNFLEFYPREAQRIILREMRLTIIYFILFIYLFVYLFIYRLPGRAVQPESQDRAVSRGRVTDHRGWSEYVQHYLLTSCNTTCLLRATLPAYIVQHYLLTSYNTTCLHRTTLPAYFVQHYLLTSYNTTCLHRTTLPAYIVQHYLLTSYNTTCLLHTTLPAYFVQHYLLTSCNTTCLLRTTLPAYFDIA